MVIRTEADSVAGGMCTFTGNDAEHGVSEGLPKDEGQKQPVRRVLHCAEGRDGVWDEVRADPGAGSSVVARDSTG